MGLNEKQIQSVLALPPERRFEHFVKEIVDREEAWGLWQDGWALAGTDDGITVFPLWPAPEYAHMCAKAEWNDFVPRAIPLDDLTDVLLPKLKAEGALAGVFFTPASKGLTPSVDDLLAAIAGEMERY